MPIGGELLFSKHHGAGNDFLVFEDLADRRRFSVPEVRALCDRHLGIGADGVLRLLAGRDGAALSMELKNGDGSDAETSGNGIRCLVQAAVEAGLVREGTVLVRTVAGLRSVEFETLGPGLGRAAVDMGPATLGPELVLDEPPGVEGARSVDMGNPHIVLFGKPVAEEVVRTVGGRLSRSVPQGANVEFAWRGGGPEALVVRVYERGVGETLACGTGACAVAAAAHEWGIVGRRVDVHLPGGSLGVELSGATIVLRGPTRKVAQVAVRESDLAQLVGELSQWREAGGPEGSLTETVGRR
jgi:diaminopimelate epimerase